MQQHLLRDTYAAIIAVYVLAIAPLHGQTPDGVTFLKNLSLEELTKIEITTVSKEASTAFTTPAAISVLTRQDIARSSARTLPDLLRLVPGVEVAQISSDKWAIGFRGFEGYLSKAVLVMIDGRSVYTPLFAGVYWEMQDTLLEDIDRIEVIRGPGATIWGANAVNGVINIITRHSSETPGNLLAAGVGNVNHADVGVRYGAGGPRLTYRLWGKGFQRDAQEHSDGVRFDDWRRQQAGFRIDWSNAAQDNIMLSGDAYVSEAGSRLALSTYSPPQLLDTQANAHFSAQNIVFAWQRQLTSGSDIQLRAYYDRTYRKDLNYREVRNTADVDFVHHIPTARHDLIWGLGIRTSPSHFYETVPTVEFLPPEETFTVYSAFAQDAIELIDQRLTFTLGSKFEHNSYSGFEIQPTGRLSWTPTERQTIWAAVTRAVRTPSRIEEGFRFTALAVPSAPLYLRLIGDGNFNPEQLVGYELGLRTYIRDIAFSVNTFYNRYNGLLSVENAPAAPEATPEPAHLVLPLTFRNGIDAQTKGVEVSALWDPTTWFRLRPSYSYVRLDASRAPNSNDASTVKQLEGDTPQHKGVATAAFTMAHGINADLTYRYVSSIPDQKVSPYSMVDVRVAKQLTRSLEVAVSGRNLLRPSHAEYGGLPGGIVEIRRSFFVSLRWTR